MARCSYFLLILILIYADIYPSAHAVKPQLGPNVPDKSVMDLFAKVGTVSVKVFDVDGTVASFYTVLDIEIQDTKDVDEYWLIDFQPFTANDPLPINMLTANLRADITSRCSSVEESLTIADHNYFHDSYFTTRTGNGNKELFTAYEKGDEFSLAGIRKDDIIFRGALETFISCTRLDGSSIWERNVYSDELEYRTVLYATNVRPQPYWLMGLGSDVPAVSFIQNTMHLVWRLTRRAILKFTIYSESVVDNVFRLFQVVFEHAIVRPSYKDDNITYDMQHAYVSIRLKTLIPIGNSTMVVSRRDGIRYLPDNNNNYLYKITMKPSTTPSQTMLCDFETDPRYCAQYWDFEFILRLDTYGLKPGKPLDASGIFAFDYNICFCEDIVTFTGCEFQEEISPWTVRVGLTLQTTFQAIDEQKDEVQIAIVKFVNSVGLDLRAGNRVSHMENVTLEVTFNPAFLREDYVLELQLFMICKGDQWAQSEMGCLAAHEDDRFTAYLSEDFHFKYTAGTSGQETHSYYTTHAYDSGNETQAAHYETLVFTSDDITPPKQSQQLNYEGYDRERDVHSMEFTNRALTEASSSIYTVTTVYYVKEQNDVTRKKRQTRSSPKKLMSSIQTPQLTSASFKAEGCPEDTLFNADELDCLCNDPRKYYDRKSLKCEYDLWDDSSEYEETDSSGGHTVTCVTLIVVSGVFLHLV